MSFNEFQVVFNWFHRSSLRSERNMNEHELQEVLDVVECLQARVRECEQEHERLQLELQKGIEAGWPRQSLWSLRRRGWTLRLA